MCKRVCDDAPWINPTNGEAKGSFHTCCPISGGILEKFLEEFFGGGEILGGSAGAPGGWRGEGLAMNMVHPLKPFPHTYIVR